MKKEEENKGTDLRGVAEVVKENAEFHEKTKRKASTSLTIKGFNTSVANLVELKMVTEEEATELNKLKKVIFERWVAIEMKM